MLYDPNVHHRRSIRLKGYDYAQAGAYYVTICVEERLSLFGRLVDQTVCLSDAGVMVQRVWDEMPSHYPGVDIDTCVVMPDHFHGILLLESPSLTLPEAVHRFKSYTTALYRHGVYEQGWPAFAGRLWQRNYFERIIRNEAELVEIRANIENNPLNAEIL